MDRKYKRAEKVNVYASFAEMEMGKPALKTVYRVPYTFAGRDYYKVDSVIRPGWLDKQDKTADACVMTDTVMGSITHKGPQS